MVDRRPRVLIVDDDSAVHLADKYILKEKYDCVSAFNGDEAKLILQNQTFDLILLDLNMRVHEEGLLYLPQLKEIDPDVDVIIKSANVELDPAARAIRAGASAYLLKGYSADQLVLTIESVLNKRGLARAHEHQQRDRKRLLQKNQILGSSPAIQKLLLDLDKIRRSNANVIIAAETGAGKELVARHIGLVDGKPFVAVDSATITNSMAESILFGHEKGAFTGALSAARGLFEEANGGTVYFDEIANMPLEIQAKLLRVLQEKEIKRVGSNKVIPLEFRVICATNRDLRKQVADGLFKNDLLERLNVIEVRIPPLRERADDVLVLAAHYLKKFSSESSPQEFSDDAMKLLKAYNWPGNVRELSNLVSNLCTMVVNQKTVEVEDLPERFRSSTLETQTIPELDQIRFSFTNRNLDFYSFMHQIEGKVLNDLYKSFDGNISQMSKQLRVSRSHLYSKLHSHGINKHV